MAAFLQHLTARVPKRAALLLALIGGVLAVSFPVPGAVVSTVTLRSQAWSVSIDAATLQVRAMPAGGAALQISAAQANLGPAADLRQTAQRVSWELPGRGIAISMRLNADTLQAHFQASKPGEFTWPVTGDDRAVKAYILPTFEGVYAPVDDPQWCAFLANDPDGLGTTDDLSMPFWGLDDGDHTLTYLLTNPFNNALAFREQSGQLLARLTHQFTRNHPVKEYGLEISLDPGSPVAPAQRYRRWLIKRGEFVTMKEKIRRTPDAAKLLGAAQVYLWDDGLAPRMIDTLAANGFDRLLLLSPGWQGLRDHPETIRKAKALGYLIGPYDSYNSIHSPDEKEHTWETAQFDRKLYDTGAIVLWNGKKKPGYLKRGYRLSPLAARPYVEKRVAGLMKEFDCNAWFIDCDAAGEFFDDYSPLHPATQEDDMKARMSRMAWIRDTYHLVIGSEGGSAFAASTIHYAHGMLTSVVGWGDPDLSNPKSPYYTGENTRQALLKPYYYRFCYDPRFHLPLYETALHDSVIATHHWSSDSLKFKDQVKTEALMELLYQVPPLYNLNQGLLAQHRAWMKAYYAFFSPLHRESALLPMTDFAWLTPDRRVQRTVFGNKMDLVANFGSSAFDYQGTAVPAESVLAHWRDSHQSRVYTPGAVE